MAENSVEQNIEAIYPLSPMQQGMLFQTLYATTTKLYTTQMQLPLVGPLDSGALQQAWQRVVDRHAILRTAFVWEELDEPLQVVGQQVDLPWVALDWQALSAEAQAAQLAEFLQADAQQGFDLTAAPLMRLTLVRLAPEQHLLLWSHHHILLDGWSVPLVVGEVRAFYEAFCQGQDLPLPPPRPYENYITWLQQQSVAQAEAFWRQTLKGFTTPTALGPGGSGRQATDTATYGEQAATLTPSVTLALQTLARQQRLTFNTLIQGVWAVLLSRYSNETDVVFGSVVAGRPAELPQVETMVGLFINTLPVRVQVPPQAELLPWLTQLQLQQLEARQYEYSPLTQVQKWSDIPRDQNLFASAVIFENYPVEAASATGAAPASGLEFRGYQIKDTPGLPLAVAAEMHGDTLALQAIYERERFSEAAIANLLGHFATLLAGISQNPHRRLGQLPMLTPAEEQQILRDWNATQAPYPAALAIHQLFEAQVARTPNAPAVVFASPTGPGRQLTYQELDQRANQLANRLKALGVGRGTLVPICVERSLEMVVGILGILKAGGAYVPLDPSYPRERLVFMLADIQAKILLTQQALVDQIPPIAGPRICLDTDWGTVAQESTIPPQSGATAQDLAYIIYTSGSTGQPKGVAVPQQAINRLVFNTNYIALDASDRIVQGSNISFDAATFELWGALLHGGRLVILPKEVMLTPATFAEQLQQQGITIMFLTTALFNQMAREAPGTFKSLRTLMFGGEAADPKSARALLADRPPQRLLNVYGPTESTTFATWHHVQHVPANAHTVPIGGPLGNTQIYVLDPQLAPVPVGVAGELYIGGEGLAWGYLNRADLTAERFIPNPFSATPGTRLYKTGDLVRYGPEGQVEFIGRIDLQVKVRGFRIELGEIEVALEKHAEVTTAVVLAREDTPGHKRLIAYVVPRRAAALEPAALQSFLKTTLPDYMVPTAYVFLATLPLNANGKVDRRALPAPDFEPSDKTVVAPRTAAEDTLLHIWQEVLHIEKISVLDNFFDLGGDSILSLQIVSRANAAGLRISPRQLFEHPTLADLAQLATAALTPQTEQGLVTGPARLLPMQHWFFEQERAEASHWHQAVWLQVPAALSPDLWTQAFRALLEHHDALRLRFTPAPTGWQAHFAPPETAVPFTVHNLAHLPPAQRLPALVAAATEVQASLDLTQGPLLRAVLFELGQEQAPRLLIVTHPLVVDDVSWRILLADLSTLCAQLQKGATPQLPTKTTSVQQWGERLHAYAQSPALQPALEKWRAITSVAGSRLPTDETPTPTGNAPDASGSLSVRLSTAETQALLQAVPKAYRTQTSDVLLTALALAFTRWSGATTLLVDLEGSGREPLFEEVDLSRTVGCFSCFYPVALTLGSTTDPGPALKSIKEQLRQVPHNGLSYGLLRYLNNDPALRAAPVAEIAFNYLEPLTATVDPAEGFGPLQVTLGPEKSPHQLHRHLLELTATVAEEQLHLTWHYNAQTHRPATIEALAQAYLGALQTLIAHCLTPTAHGYTPSDFPLASLTQAQLDQLTGAYPQLEDLYPLAPMQEGMLFHTLSTAGSMYFQQFAYTLQGALNVTAFEQAWQQATMRHAILRTAFVWEALDAPVQVVLPQVQLPWVQQDWRTLPAPEQEQRFTTFLQQDRQQPFDLFHPPLLRLALFRLSDTEHYFVWSFHHILLDGWSVSALLAEVMAGYQALATGQAWQPAAAPAYHTYIAWLQRQDAAAAEAFWRRKLQGLQTPTRMVDPSQKASGSAPVGALSQLAFTLPSATSAALHALARQHQLTINTFVQGAWALLLSYYTRETDVVFGATTAGRPADLPGVENILGLFINTLPVRVQIPPAMAVMAWLKALQAQQVESRQYEYAPLVEVQRWSGLPTNQALFETIVVFENFSTTFEDTDGSSAGLSLQPIRSFGEGNYTLSLLASFDQQVMLSLFYDGQHFTVDFIQRLKGHLQTLLTSMAEQPALPLAHLQWVTPAEQAQLLRAWNTTATPYSEACFHELFEAQVAQTPNAPALTFESQTFTYQELNTQANQLAHYLRQQGVGPEVRVGVCMERSPQMIIAFLAIFKAGGAYLPLDPAYPAERLAYMLTDAQASLLLTQTQLQARLPQTAARVVCVDAEAAAIQAEATHNLPTVISQQNLAYIIYTSGSTGRPKGVMVSHAGLGNLSEAQSRAFGLGANDRVLQLASFSFDASVSEIIMAWRAGATLCLGSQEALRPGPEFVQWLEAQAITKMTISPSALAALPEAALPNLGAIVVAGEACSAELVARWAPDRRFFNAYGPTEATVCATIAKCQPNMGPPPIGRPMANVQMYVLDKHLQPVPVGVAGELHIGSVGLARGYFGRPDLTAEKFIPNPFSTVPGARLYKTGDLGRYRADGNLEFLGRIDHQVKVRGFRIELAEIETVLAQYVGVQDGVVIVREDEPGDKRLVAYLVANTAQPPSPSDLRAFLKARLPDYMVPAAFVFLGELPLTPNGKVNRKALPRPEMTHLSSEDFVAPRDALELQLAQVWEEVLNVRPISMTDSFFNLGGHSILAVRLLARIQKNLGHKLALPVFFQAATIEGMANILREQVPAQPRTPIVPIQPQGTHRPFFCVHPGSGDVFAYYALSRHLGEDQPFYGIQDPRLDWVGDTYPDVTLEAMAAEYVTAMQAIQPQGPYLLGGHSFGGQVVFAMAHQLRQQGQAVALLAIFDTAQPLLLKSIGQSDDAVLLAIIAGLDLQQTVAHLRTLTPQAQTEYILERMSQSNPWLKELGPEWSQRQIETFKSRIRAIGHYDPPVYAGAITLFRSTDTDHSLYVEDLKRQPNSEAVVEQFNQPTWGWDTVSIQPVTVYYVPGDHEEMLKEPQVRELARQLRACLKAAQ